MADDVEREKLMDQHTKVGKDYKRQVQDREFQLDEVEHQLVQEALKLPNRTHVDSPVGDESKNRLVAENGTRMIGDNLPSHLDIAVKFDLLDFSNASKLI